MSMKLEQALEHSDNKAPSPDTAAGFRDGWNCAVEFLAKAFDGVDDKTAHGVRTILIND